MDVLESDQTQTQYATVTTLEGAGHTKSVVEFLENSNTDTLNQTILPGGGACPVHCGVI